MKNDPEPREKTVSDIAHEIAQRVLAEHEPAAVAILLVKRVSDITDAGNGAQRMRMVGGNSLLYGEGCEVLLLGLEHTVGHLVGVLQEHLSAHGLRAGAVSDLTTERSSGLHPLPKRPTKLDS